jgi:hypothetical protein
MSGATEAARHVAEANTLRVRSRQRQHDPRIATTPGVQNNTVLRPLIGPSPKSY